MAASWKKDIGRLLERANRQGFRIEKRKGGHIRIIPPDKNQSMIMLSSTPGDSRSVKNARSLLRRRGFVG
jgi:hypothetical protein